MIRVYVDASVYANPGPGGIGVIVEHNGSMEMSKGFPVTEERTCACLELLAVVEGLNQIRKMGYGDKKITLYTDSSYAQGIARRKYRPKKNLEECMKLMETVESFRYLEIRHIEGKKNPADTYAWHASQKAAIETGMKDPVNKFEI